MIVTIDVAEDGREIPSYIPETQEDVAFLDRLEAEGKLETADRFAEMDRVDDTDGT